MVNKSMDELSQESSGLFQLTNFQRSWQDSTMTFSTVAKAGFLKAPIHGTVLVTEVDVTINADLGLFEKVLTPQQAQSLIGGRLKGLLS